MGDIILKIPDGTKCLGCMFLKIEYMHNIAVCNLFKENLDSRRNWGDIDEATVEKCDRCPKGE